MADTAKQATLQIGGYEETWGYLSLDGDGNLHMEGNKRKLESLIHSLRGPRTNAEFMASLPRRLNSPPTWAVPIARSDETDDSANE